MALATISLCFFSSVFFVLVDDESGEGDLVVDEDGACLGDSGPWAGEADVRIRILASDKAVGAMSCSVFLLPTTNQPNSSSFFFLVLVIQPLF